jgi:hypothetical protein
VGIGIWELLIIILLVGAIYGTYRFAKRTPPANASSNGPVGVGGWLLLLVAGLMVLGPLIGAGRINSDIMSTEAQYPNLKTIEAWSTFKTITWWSFLVVCCLSFYAGFGLAKGRDMSVVRRAKILLWVIGPAASLVMGIFIPLVVFGKIESDPQLFGAFIGSIITAAIWTAYLSKSKRVKSTYGTASQLST